MGDDEHETLEDGTGVDCSRATEYGGGAPGLTVITVGEETLSD